ncbi:MAG TPA: M48 family metallopeptidase [Verrucomicrobiae bacterium]|nr:M48 family metallopeptidase [Verrucomicrobiae bacterium]
MRAVDTDEAQARRYHRRQFALTLVDLLLGVLILVWWSWSGAAAGLAKALDLRLRSPAAVVAAITLALGASQTLVTSPLDIVAGFVLPRRAGLLTQTFGSWLGDRAKGLAIGGLLGLLSVEVVYGLLRWSPDRWWLWASGVLALGIALLTAVVPVWLVPLFYRLTPLPDGPLKRRLLALAARVGVPVTGVWVVDQSRKSRTANAAVTGLGRTRRILLFDTLLDTFTPDEVEAVLAHELAHQLHGDIRRGLLVQGVLTLATFWVASGVLRAGGAWLHLAGPADVAGLPLFGLVVLAVGLAALPAANGWSRHVEHAADRFALETLPDPEPFIGAMERLATLNLAEREPHPIEEFFLYSHPPIGRRIAYARQFDRGLT